MHFWGGLWGPLADFWPPIGKCELELVIAANRELRAESWAESWAELRAELRAEQLSWAEVVVVDDVDGVDDDEGGGEEEEEGEEGHAQKKI